MNDLDVKVAKALGWKNHNGPIGWVQPNGKRARWGACPRYSEDSVELWEPVAWLIARGQMSVRQGALAVLAEHVDNEGRRVAAEGATLFEAVARLVYACASTT